MATRRPRTDGLARPSRPNLKLGDPLARLGAVRGERLVSRDLLRGEGGFHPRAGCPLLGTLSARCLSRGDRRSDLAGDLLGLRAMF